MIEFPTLIDIPQQAWTFWFYLCITSLMTANSTVIAYLNFLPSKPNRSPIVALGALLSYAISLGWACTTLVAADFHPVMLPLYMQRFAWMLVLSSAFIMTDLAVARLNGRAAGVYRLLHWWARLPKRKLSVYVLLFATLYMVTSCVPVSGLGRYWWHDLDLVCLTPVDYCEPPLGPIQPL